MLGRMRRHGQSVNSALGEGRAKRGDFLSFRFSVRENAVVSVAGLVENSGKRPMAAAYLRFSI